MNHPNSAPPLADEKGHTDDDLPPTTTGALPSATTTSSPPSPQAHRSLVARLLSPGYLVEARGITRVLPSETHALTWQSYAQAFVLWFSINLAAVNVTLGMLAPALFGLSFRDAALCAVLGSGLGSCAVAYTATWGAKGGVRTMIFARYIMGWWPGKLVVVLNVIVLLGYAMIDCVVAGQILSAVSPGGSMSVSVGIVIVAVITLLVTTFGIRVFHYYERYAFIPQLIAICILFGVSAKNFDLTTPSTGDARTVIGSRISFFSLCFSAAITYAGVAADYFVYYPPTTPAAPLFVLSLLGLSTSFSLALIAGIGLASGLAANADYAAAYSISQGALLVRALDPPLGAFGRVVAVVIALGLVANLIPPTYSAALGLQLLARAAARVPRWAWNALGVVVYTACALAGRDSLAAIFTNFLALMGYWLAIWMAITLEEHLLFRDGWGQRGWRWEDWDTQDRLPLGLAALAAFLVGWAGAILCMAQVWYTGPIAKLVGEFGADMGNYVGFAWAALVYPPLRWLELRMFDR